ncbi:MAG: hypothetical protein KA764_22590, partial [Anaerolineales bacterium]|nr:hypothetical protein [Anaerolineales bacterium]
HEVRVKVLQVDARKKQIKLSIKAVDLAELAEASAEVEEDLGEDLTAMQLAFRRAQQKAGGRALGKRSDKAQPTRRQQEDLLQRTLANKRK